MSVESASYINQLNESNPTSSDLKSEGDNHIRLLKSTLKTTFPNVTGAVTATHTELNSIGSKLSTSGGTMTGQITLPGGGTGNQAATVSQLVAEIAAASSVNLPSQTGNAGKFLTTDGTTPSWGATGGSWVYLSAVTASNSTTVDVETTFDSTYDEYVVVITGYRASVASGDLRARLKIGGAYDTASNYVYRANHSDSSNATFSNAVNASVGAKAAFIPVCSGNSATNAAGFALSAMVFISNPASTSLVKSIQAVGRAINSAGQIVQIDSFGYNTGTAAMTGIRFYDWSGNLASGTFRLYGIKKS